MSKKDAMLAAMPQGRWTLDDPDQNIVVASPHGPLAEKGANDLIEPELLAENLISAVPFTCG